MNPWLNARRFLAIRPDNIGDVVMLGPALRAIKQTIPEAEITLLASPAGATAAALLPWIDDVLVQRTIWQDLGHLSFDPQRELELVARLRERQFDAALIFSSFSQTPHAPGYLCYLAGIPLRAGEGKEFGGRVLSVELRGAADELHQTERNLRLVEALGFVVHDRRLQIEIPAVDRASLDELLSAHGIDPQQPYILLHPGASASARRYPPEQSGELARLLTTRGHQLLITGVPREQALLDQVCARAPLARSLAGGTTLGQMAALVERAGLVICGNTLPLHLSDALMTPVLGLYSGTDYESQWRPRFTRHRLLRRETPCYPCYLFECPVGLACLDLTPQLAAQAAEELLQAREVSTEYA